MFTQWKILPLQSTTGARTFRETFVFDIIRFWATAQPERKATVEVEFAQPEKIAVVNIVNAGAAFIELLVAKQGSTDFVRPRLG
jgi:hypothetical protein